MSDFFSKPSKGYFLPTHVLPYNKFDGFLFRIVAETSTGCLLAGSSLGKRGEKLGNKAYLYSAWLSRNSHDLALSHL